MQKGVLDYVRTNLYRVPADCNPCPYTQPEMMAALQPLMLFRLTKSNWIYAFIQQPDDALFTRNPLTDLTRLFVCVHYFKFTENMLPSAEELREAIYNPQRSIPIGKMKAIIQLYNDDCVGLPSYLLAPSAAKKEQLQHWLDLVLTNETPLTRLLRITDPPPTESVVNPDELELLTTDIGFAPNCAICLAPLSVPVRGKLCKHMTLFDRHCFSALIKNRPQLRCPAIGCRNLLNNDVLVSIELPARPAPTNPGQNAICID